jgi:hypothetical protein
VEPVRAGDSFVAAQDIPTSALTSCKAPATFGFDTVIREGPVLVAPDDAGVDAPGFSCIPERYEELERALVPEEDRLHPKYDGFYFVLDRAAIGSKLRRL